MIMHHFLTAVLIFLVLGSSSLAGEPLPVPSSATEVEVTSQRIEKFLPGHKVIFRSNRHGSEKDVIVQNLSSGRSSCFGQHGIGNEYQHYFQNVPLSAFLASLNICVPDNQTAIELSQLVEDLGYYQQIAQATDSHQPQKITGRDPGKWKFSAEWKDSAWIVKIDYTGPPASICAPPTYVIRVTKDFHLVEVDLFFLLLSQKCPDLKRASALIRPASDGTHFVRADTSATVTAWGFNYDHDSSSRLIEDYWVDEWQTVLEDFLEMKMLGANAVRIHPQLGRFMKSPTEPDEASLAQLKRLVEYSLEIGLYLDITGLGCYYKKQVPAWYDTLDEAARWEVQALFWENIARVCADSPAVFFYDLMNEPVLPGEGEKATEWLAGEFAGMCFVQRITLDLAGRTREQVAKAWVDKLVTAIRKYDQRHMITVGAIPWAYTFPGAKPILYSPEVSQNLDCVCVHFYPKKGDVENALKALWVYDIGKPLVVEEMFPLECGQDDLAAFVNGSRDRVDGYFGFYWGKSIEEYAQQENDLSAKITQQWLMYFHDKAREIWGVKSLFPH